MILEKEEEGGTRKVKVQTEENLMENNNAEKAAVDIHTHTHNALLQRKSLLLFMKRNFFFPDAVTALSAEITFASLSLVRIKINQRYDW